MSARSRVVPRGPALVEECRGREPVFFDSPDDSALDCGHTRVWAPTPVIYSQTMPADACSTVHQNGDALSDVRRAVVEVLRSEFRSESVQLRAEVHGIVKDIVSEVLPNVNCSHSLGSRIHGTVSEVLDEVREHNRLLGDIKAIAATGGNSIGRGVDLSAVIMELRSMRSDMDRNKQLSVEAVCKELQQTKASVDVSVIIQSMRDMEPLVDARSLRWKEEVLESIKQIPQVVLSRGDTTLDDLCVLVREHTAKVATGMAQGFEKTEQSTAQLFGKLDGQFSQLQDVIKSRVELMLVKLDEQLNQLGDVSKSNMDQMSVKFDGQSGAFGELIDSIKQRVEHFSQKLDGQLGEIDKMLSSRLDAKLDGQLRQLAEGIRVREVQQLSAIDQTVATQFSYLGELLGTRQEEQLSRLSTILQHISRSEVPQSGTDLAASGSKQSIGGKPIVASPTRPRGASLPGRHLSHQSHGSPHNWRPHKS